MNNRFFTASRLLDPLFTTPEMQEAFSDGSFVTQMLAFETALLRALEQSAFAPSGSSAALEACCGDIRFDMRSLALESRDAGNIAIPFVKQLTSALHTRNAEAAAFVHWGATSQDVQDTATVLEIRAGLGLLLKDVDILLQEIASLTRRFSATPMAGRTWLQQAPPVTFGLKMAGYLESFLRHRQRLLELHSGTGVLSFGGAVGTLAPFGSRGREVAVLLARHLGLRPADTSWHTQRDRIAEVACGLGLVAGTLGKLGRDLSLLMQTEIAEIAEPFSAGRGGSSTMPHKRNPIGSCVMLSAATRVPPLVATMLAAMVQEHERGLGGWHAEWETLPEIFRLTAGSLRHACVVLEGLEVHAEAMRDNLQHTDGCILSEAVFLALAGKIGKSEMHRLLEEASREALAQRLHLGEVLSKQPEILAHLSAQEIAELLDADNYLGSAQQEIEAVLTKYEEALRAGL